MLNEKELIPLLEKHQTSLNGLTEDEAIKRQKLHGFNLLQAKKKKTLIVTFLEEFKDLMVLLLILAAFIALIGGEGRDAAVIFFIVILNSTIGFVQKYRAEKAIEALRKLVAPKAKVIRDGAQKEIDAREVVPGDILVILEGDNITADAVLFEANELQTLESALTGESVPVQKLTRDLPETNATESEKENVVFMGTNVAHGSGKAIVIGTGMNTQMGQVAKLTTETKKDLSPLEKELQRIGIFVGKIALVISVILFVVGVTLQGKHFVDALLFASSVAVAAVPEGLPATVTIALAIGVQRLAKKNAIMKQLSAVETLGSTTVICSDKTGTLTKNEMTVKELYFDQYEASVRGVGYNPQGSIHIEQNNKHCVTIGEENGMYEDYEHQREDLLAMQRKQPNVFNSLEILIIAAGLCNNADLHMQDGQWKITGDPTEGALLTLGEKAGFDLQKLREQYEKIYELSFDSTRKRMTVILKNRKTGEYWAVTKGAPDSIIDVSQHLSFNGREVKLDKDGKNSLIELNESMARRALRGLGFAYRTVSETEINKGKKEGSWLFLKDDIEKNMTFVGMIGMIDPPRPEVKAAVDMAHKAGIRTYIITGDHGLTAEAIAKQLNIIGQNQRKHIIMTGEDVNNINDKELSAKLNEKNLDIIFARVSPEHKLRIVTLLKASGEVVAVTGDGVNDAPALKRADIGVAMGISGTDVSKEASNMVLADDSYSTIVTAIKEGRTIYDNLKKFVFYVFSCNIAELLTIFVAIILGLPSPLTAILILCIDVGTDVLPAVALGIDPSEPGIMNRKPRDPKEKIMTKPFVERYLYLGLIMGALVMGTYIWTLYRYGWSWGQVITDDSQVHLKGSSVAFALLVIIQMVNAFNSRSEKNSIFKLGFFTNPFLLGAIAISILTTIAIVEIPFMQTYLHTTSLNFSDWSIILGASLIVLVVEEMRKIFVRKKYG
jgi:Ca2+-transporting ATPase